MESRICRPKLVIFPVSRWIRAFHAGFKRFTMISDVSQGIRPFRHRLSGGTDGASRDHRSPT